MIFAYQPLDLTFSFVERLMIAFYILSPSSVHPLTTSDSGYHNDVGVKVFLESLDGRFNGTKGLATYTCGWIGVDVEYRTGCTDSKFIWGIYSHTVSLQRKRRLI